jgi:hypothetical protein
VFKSDFGHSSLQEQFLYVPETESQSQLSSRRQFPPFSSQYFLSTPDRHQFVSPDPQHAPQTIWLLELASGLEELELVGTQSQKNLPSTSLNPSCFVPEGQSHSQPQVFLFLITWSVPKQKPDGGPLGLPGAPKYSHSHLLVDGL